MEGAAQASGGAPSLELNGERLLLAPLTFKVWGLLEAEVKSRRGNPLDLIRENKDMFAGAPELLETFVRKSFQEAKSWHIVSRSEVFSWMQTIDGTVYTLWLLVRDNNPEKYTYEYIAEAVWAETLKATKDPEKHSGYLQKLHNAIDSAAGLDPLGN